jgi:hypothetical protein
MTAAPPRDRASYLRSRSPGWWHCQQHTSSDRTPLARMLPKVGEVGSASSRRWPIFLAAPQEFSEAALRYPGAIRYCHSAMWPCDFSQFLTFTVKSRLATIFVWNHSRAPLETNSHAPASRLAYCMLTLSYVGSTKRPEQFANGNRRSSRKSESWVISSRFNRHAAAKTA